jgi:hypothetical protein
MDRIACKLLCIQLQQQQYITLVRTVVRGYGCEVCTRSVTSCGGCLTALLDCMRPPVPIYSFTPMPWLTAPSGLTDVAWKLLLSGQ